MRSLILLGILLILSHDRVSYAKSGRTLYSDQEVRQARSNIAKFDWAKNDLRDAKKPVEWVLAMSDSELWDFIPPADQPRALNVRFGIGCPVHGKEIFKAGGHYPWIMDRQHPFKVKCPIGGEVYPSNDFETWYKSGKKEKLDTHQKYVDDGYGWIDDNGNHYWFVAHYIFWQRWRTDILPVIPQLSSLYLLTGDTRYSHKAAVMLARIASEYPKMDYLKQAYHNGEWPAPCRGKILDYDWEGSATVVPLSTAYDQIYDSLEGDAQLKEFLQTKGISNVREFVEKNFLQEAARCIEAGIIHGNMNYQEQLAVVAAVLDNHDPAKGLTTKQMVDWIMNGGGEMNMLLYNGISRDGACSEEAIGYNTIWTMAFYNLAKHLKSLGFDLYANPRMRKMADFYIGTTVADKYSPRIGDVEGSINSPASPVWIPSIFYQAYLQWRDPMYAKVLNRIGWPSSSIYENPKLLENMKAKAAKLGTKLNLPSRDLGGYGLAVLEAGSGDYRRALSLYYGSSGAWHGHYDKLNIEMWVHGTDVLPEMGYPAHWGEQADLWTKSTPSHYCVLIDENRQSYKMEGNLNLLAVLPGVQIADASAESAYLGDASLYRRTVAMVDASENDSYLIDVFRVRGGQQHDYSFHGLPFGEFRVTGVDLGPVQEKGTLMGEDVEYGKTFAGMKTGGYQYLFNVRRGKPDAAWSANWWAKDKDVGLKMTMLPGCAQEVITADCKPEAMPGYPDRMEYVLARNRTKGLSSYVSVIEPYKHEPFIKQISPLKSTGETPREDLAAVRVDLPSRTDYIISALDSDNGLRFDSDRIFFQGIFGSVSRDADGLRSFCLVNGKELQSEDWGIRPSEMLRAKVIDVDYQNNKITIDRQFPVPAAVAGQVAIISNPAHSTSYTVTKIETKRRQSVLHFGDISIIEGIGNLKSVDNKAKVVVSDNRFSGYGIKWDGKFLPGRALVNEAKTHGWRITRYDSGHFTIDAGDDLPALLKQANGTTSSVFYLGEITVGDEVVIPASVSVARIGKRTYAVHAAVPFELTVPSSLIGSGGIEYKTGEEWKKVGAEKLGRKATVQVTKQMLKSGEVILRVAP